MIAKLQQGIWPWKPPIGYRCAQFKKRGEKKTDADPPDEAIFPIIQRGLQEFAAGTFASQVQLAEALDSWGLRAIRGEKIHRQLVDRMLGKFLPFYAGVLVNPWTGDQIQGLHKAMITREEMHNIRLIRAGKARLGRRMKRDRHNPAFPLKGTVMCASCNRPFTGSAPRGNGGRYYYYHCKNSLCAEYAKSIPKVILEKAFTAYLEHVTPKEKVLAIIRESVKEIWEENGIGLKVQAERHEKTIATLREKKARISELLEEGTYSSSYGRERLAELEDKLVTANIALNETRTDQFDIESAILYATHFVSNLGRQWFDLAPELRPRFQKLIFPEGAPYARFEGFGTAKLGLIYEISCQSEGDLSRVVDLMGRSWNQFVVELKVWSELASAARAHSAV
jgi:site-specific DNA recombinase